MIDLSVIIVNYNTKKLLINCIDSIVKDIYGFTNEIIVVDNASCDDSVSAVLSEFPDVIIIQNKENLGFAKANNIAMRQSKGKYICLINSDVVVLKQCFNNLVKFMDTHPEIGMAGPQLLNSDMTIQISCKKIPSVWNTFTQTFLLHRLFSNSEFFSTSHMTFFPHDIPRKIEALAGAFLMVRKDAIDQVGLLDEDYFFYSEDIDWCKRFREVGWSIMFYPEAKAIHHDGSSSKNDPFKSYIKLYQAKLLYWKKHHGFFKFILVKNLIVLHHLIRIILNALKYLITNSSTRVSISSEINKNFKSIPYIYKYSYN